MTIIISPQAYDELLQQEIAQQSDLDDPRDVMLKFPQLLGQGYWREIELREGLNLVIGDFQLYDRLLETCPEGEVDWLEYHFHFTGEHQTENCSLSAGQFSFSGSGLTPKAISDALDTQPYLEVMIYIKIETLRSFMGNPAGELSPELQPLIRPSDQQQYCRTGTATPAMQTVARRILECPYQGISKRLYLESKALELLGLLVAQEIKLRDGTISPHSLKPDVVDRVHHARDILLQRLENPPSLVELARQVGVNECTLKRGFRQIFDTTVFGYLFDHRMEQARKLLETQIYTVEDVARMVGYRNLSAFSKAFLRRYGIRARDCLKRGRLKTWV